MDFQSAWGIGCPGQVRSAVAIRRLCRFARARCRVSCAFLVSCCSSGTSRPQPDRGRVIWDALPACARISQDASLQAWKLRACSRCVPVPCAAGRVGLIGGHLAAQSADATGAIIAGCWTGRDITIQRVMHRQIRPVGIWDANDDGVKRVAPQPSRAGWVATGQRSRPRKPAASFSPSAVPSVMQPVAISWRGDRCNGHLMGPGRPPARPPMRFPYEMGPKFRAAAF